MNSESFFLEANDAFPVNKLVHQLFFEQAGQHPDRIALVEGDKELTYGELDRITDSIAAGLIAHGIRTDDAAGIFIDRSINKETHGLGIFFLRFTTRCSPACAF